MVMILSCSSVCRISHITRALFPFQQENWIGPIDVFKWDAERKGALPEKFASLVYLEDASEANPAVGTEFLGRPIGTPKFEEDIVVKAAKKAIAVLEGQRGLSKQVSFQLTKYSVISKLTHLLRSVPPAQTAKGIALFEAALRGDSETAWIWDHLEISPSSISEEERQRLCDVTHLGHGDGGLALTNLCVVQRYAFFSGFHDALNTKLAVHTKLVSNLRQLDQDEFPMLRAAAQQIVEFREFLGLTAFELLSDDEQDALDADERKRLKFASEWVPLNLAEMLDDEKRKEPKYKTKSKREESMQCKMGMCANEKLQADYERKLARLKSCSWLANYLDQKQPEATAWLKVMPAEKALSFTDNEWTATVRYFVGIADGRLNLIPGQTCACGAAFSETHPENCKLRGWLTRRSDAVINVALEEARDCLWRTDQERAIPVNQKGEPAEGRMDGVCWPSGKASGKPISFDVTVVTASRQAGRWRLQRR